MSKRKIETRRVTRLCQKNIGVIGISLPDMHAALSDTYTLLIQFITSLETVQYSHFILFNKLKEFPKILHVILYPNLNSACPFLSSRPLPIFYFNLHYISRCLLVSFIFPFLLGSIMHIRPGYIGLGGL
jgi:hypothetical protein